MKKRVCPICRTVFTHTDFGVYICAPICAQNLILLCRRACLKQASKELIK